MVFRVRQSRHDGQLPDGPRTDPGVRFSRTGVFAFTLALIPSETESTVSLMMRSSGGSLELAAGEAQQVPRHDELLDLLLRSDPLSRASHPGAAIPSDWITQHPGGFVLYTQLCHLLFYFRP